MKVDWTKDHGMQRIRGGRTVKEQIECIRKEGNLVPKSVLRDKLLAELGMRKKTEEAPNVFIFGCNFPFQRHALLRSYLELLDRLVPDYTFLDKEFCCGGPMIELADGADKEEAEESSREFMKMNLSMAQAVGAKNMVYWCIWCAYLGKKSLGDSGVAQMYFPDLILERLQQESLKLPPMTIGYYEGCHARGQSLAPNEYMNWRAYRNILDRIDGLHVVDLPNEVCCVLNAPRVVEIAVSQHLETIVCCCAAGYTRLNLVANGKVKIRYWPEIVLQALGGSVDS